MRPVDSLDLVFNPKTWKRLAECGVHFWIANRQKDPRPRLSMLAKHLNHKTLT